MNRKVNFNIAALTAMVFALALGTGCSGTSGGAMTDGGPDFNPTGVEIVDPMDPMDPILDTMDEETLVLHDMPETIYDSVIVPPCQTATLSGTTVEGNVFVMAGAVFYADGVVIKGNVQAYMSSLVDLAQTYVDGDVQGDKTRSVIVRDGAEVKGNVQISEAYAPEVVYALLVDNSTVYGDVQAEKSTGSLTVTATTIEGNLQFVENYTGPYTITYNDIYGDLQFFKNQGEGTITDNYVGGNLQSKENYPWPTISDNMVEGYMEVE